MSYFYGYLKGCRGESTRCGSKLSGIKTHIRSWNNDVYCSLSCGKPLDENALKSELQDELRIDFPLTLKVVINGKEYKQK